MQVDAVCASVDLRNSPEDEVDQFAGQVGARGDVVVDAEDSLYTLRRHLALDQPFVFAHDVSLCSERRRSTLGAMTGQAVRV